MLMTRVFGRRYRQVVKGWEASMRGPAKVADRRYVSAQAACGNLTDTDLGSTGQVRLYQRSIRRYDKLLWLLS